MNSLPNRDIAHIAAALADFKGQWAIAGGWALDLWLGRQTRKHADVDVAVFRSDQAALRQALPGWQFHMMADGVLQPWRQGLALELPIHEIHVRPPHPHAGAIECLLNERAGDDWVYRRAPAIRRPLSLAIRTLGGGVSVLAPEIVLLFKSKAPRLVDDTDFDLFGPLLDAESRAWLAAALRHVQVAHPWMDRLRSSPDEQGQGRLN